MATRDGKRSVVESKACSYVPKMRTVRVGGKAKPVKGKITRRGDS